MAWRSGLILSAVLMAVLISCSEAQLSRSRYRRLRRSFRSEIRRNQRLLPRMVQMAFHDCVGGCDGCVDTQVADNKNLGPVVSFAREFRRRRAPQLSQADVNIFIATQALEATARRARSFLRLPFYIGRQDCDSSNGFPQRKFPTGQNIDSIGFLQRTFGVSTSEAVALLGCHTLGRTHADVTGFDGPWTFTEFALDTGYFQNMRSSGWRVERRHTGSLRSSQWSKQTRSGKTMMLHADMILFKRFATSNFFDNPSCSYSSCPSSPTASIVTTFSNSRRQFYSALRGAFIRMTAAGHHGRLTRVV